MVSRLPAGILTPFIQSTDGTSLSRPDPVNAADRPCLRALIRDPKSPDTVPNPKSIVLPPVVDPEMAIDPETTWGWQSQMPTDTGYAAG